MTATPCTAASCTTSTTALTIGGAITNGPIKAGMVVTYPAQSVPTAVAILAGGTGYTNGTYTAVACLSANVGAGGIGLGTGMTVTATVAGGIVTAISIASTAAAVGYQALDCLTIATGIIGTGTGFFFKVTAGGLPISPPCTVVSGSGTSWTLSASLGLSSGTTLTFEEVQAYTGIGATVPTTLVSSFRVPSVKDVPLFVPPQPLPQTLTGSTVQTSSST